MAETLVQLNGETEAQCEAVRDRLAATSALLLITSDVTPSPATNPGALVEAGYDGYEPHNLVGEWGAVVEDEVGIYSTSTGEIEFAPPAVGPSETVRLVALEEDGVIGWLCRLTTPWVAQVGGVPLRLRLKYVQFSASVLVD